MDSKVKNAENIKQISPQQAVDLLKDGNARFVANNLINRNHKEVISKTKDAQYPFAIILSCIDSRVIPELIFDQGIGDIFVVRIAGNIINNDILGSMEYACAVTGSKLILVLGHTACGAVEGAVQNIELGNLTNALSQIKLTVDDIDFDGDKTSVNKEFINAVARKNIDISINKIKENSSILKELYDNKAIDIVGSIYDNKNGNVEFI